MNDDIDGLRYSETDLREMVPHVRYELERMAFWSRHQIGPHAIVPHRDRDQLVILLAQATLECALLHLRNVADFLRMKRGGPPHERSLTADDYFDGGWPHRATTLLADTAREHQQAMEQLHGRLAHLSLQRLDRQRDSEDAPQPFEWDEVLGRTQRVTAAYGIFLDDLQTEHPDRRAWGWPTVAELGG